jgi:hypothetical protein
MRCCHPLLQAAYILGDNPLGMSYLVGYGATYPLQPQHRSASCDPNPAVSGEGQWPGQCSHKHRWQPTGADMYDRLMYQLIYIPWKHWVC